MHQFVSRALALGLVILLAVPTLVAADKPLVRIGLNVKGVLRSGDAIAANADPITHFLEHLNTSPSYRFEVVRLESPEDVYEALKTHAIDVGRFGPTYYAKAHYEFGAVPLVGDNDELVSVLVVRKDSPVKKVSDLAGRTLALGYPMSTTSHLVPLLLLSKGHLTRHMITEDAAEAKADPKKVHVVFVGTHDKVAAEVLAGRVDAGGMIFNEYERNKSALRALDTSEPFPGTPVVAHPALSAAARSEFTRLALAYKPSEADGPFGKGFRAIHDEDFNKVRFLCQVVLGVKYVK